MAFLLNVFKNHMLPLPGALPEPFSGGGISALGLSNGSYTRSGSGLLTGSGREVDEEDERVDDLPELLLGDDFFFAAFFFGEDFFLAAFFFGEDFFLGDLRADLLADLRADFLEDFLAVFLADFFLAVFFADFFLFGAALRAFFFAAISLEF